MDILPYLNTRSEQLIADFSLYFGAPLSEEVRCVEVTILRERLPSVPFIVSYCDRFRGPTKGVKAPKLLSGVTHLIEPSIYDDRESQIVDCFYREENNLEGATWDELQKTFQSEDLCIARWIRDCWQKSKISQSIENAYCFDEDGWFKPINLVTGEHLVHLNKLNDIFDG